MIKPSMSLPSPTFCVESLVSPPHTRASKTRVEGRIPDNNDSMNSLSFVAIVLLSLVLGIANGFVVPSPSSLNVRQHVGGGGMSMLFGGGAKKTAKGGLIVKVQQKTGFKETEITLAGKMNLRKALLDNKIDVYPLQVSDSWDDQRRLRKKLRTCAKKRVQQITLVLPGSCFPPEHPSRGSSELPRSLK